MYNAKDVMNRKVVTARPEMTREEIRELLVSNKIGGAPVVNAKGVLLGVISMGDILGSEMNSAYAFSLSESKSLDRILEEEGFHLEQVTECYVSDFMTRDIVRAFPETPVTRLAELMYQHRIHRVIIVEAHTNKVKGIVTTFDLLRVLKDLPNSCDNRNHEHPCKNLATTA